MPDIETRVDKLEGRVNTMERNQALLQQSISSLDKTVSKLDDTLDSFLAWFTEMKIGFSNNENRLGKLEEYKDQNEKDKSLNLAVLFKENIWWVAIIILVLAIKAGLI